MAELRRTCCGTPAQTKHEPGCRSVPHPGVTPLTSGWEPFWTSGELVPALARLVKCPKCRALVDDRDAMTHEMAVEHR